MDENELIEERKRKLKDFLFKKNFIVIILLLVLLGLAWQIRTANLPGLKDITTGEYTLGPDLDPWVFYRYAKSIVETGSLPKIDTMRYAPLGYDTSKETQLLPYMMAYFHKIIGSNSVIYSAALFPAFMFLLTVIAFFLLVGKIFDNHKYRWYIAALASIFLMIFPSFLPRTVAGIPEKESAAFFFMFLAFYFFIWAFKEEKEKKSYILASLAGLSTVLMGLIWGGVIYVYTTIGIFGFFLWILGRRGRKEVVSYGIWAIIGLILLPILYPSRISLTATITSTSGGLCIGALMLIGIDYFLTTETAKKISFIEDLKRKYPKKIISLVFFIIIAIVFSSLFFGIKFIPNFIGDITQSLTQPIEDRFSLTVAENRQPYFNEWGNDFGPRLSRFSVSFWLFIIGSILLFYKTITLNKKDKIYLTCAYAFFLFALIFSRYAGDSILNGVNTTSKLLYFAGVAVFGLYFFYLSYNYEKNHEEIMLREFNISYLFLFALFFVAIVGARSAIRLVMVLVPPASILIAFMPFEIFNKYNESGKEQKNIWIGILIFVSFLILFTGYKFYQTTYATAQSYVPTVYNQQWQKAMSWVRNNTEKDAVFSHWWDYGYWIQSIGNRPTMLDGGNFIVYWNHLFGYHVLTGYDNTKALQLLKTHNVSYLLIDSTDIGKYPAYSSIGSDENYNKYSWLTTFVLNEKATKELRNETEFYYDGSYVLDQDFVYKTNDSETLFPYRMSAIRMIKVRENEEKVTGADALFVNYQGKQAWVPLACVFYENKKYEFNNGYDGCLRIIPMIVASGTQLNKKGAGIFTSSRVKPTLFARLYLFNEEPEGFELVHEEKDYVVEALNNQGLNLSDFVVYNSIKGPIKIWKITYPQNIDIVPEWLETSYPSEELRLAKSGYY
jgi:asparagine N-glycosylation enzyme membrane subunit Stt3